MPRSLCMTLIAAGLAAAALGYGALAITDECTLAGVVRAHLEAKAQQLHLVIGSEIRLTLPGSGAPHARLVLLAETRRGYGNLSHWITVCRRRAEKGSYLAHPGDVEGRCRTRRRSPACPSAWRCSCPRPRSRSRTSSRTRCG